MNRTCKPDAKLHVSAACARGNKDICGESGCAYGEEVGADDRDDEGGERGWEGVLYV